MYYMFLLYIKECPNGYFGKNCSKACPLPFFGKKCQQKCSCKSDQCDFMIGCKNNGQCLSFFISCKQHRKWAGEGEGGGGEAEKQVCTLPIFKKKIDVIYLPLHPFELGFSIVMFRGSWSKKKINKIKQNIFTHVIHSI